MAKKNNINNSALSKLCSYIALASQQGQLINDTLQAQDKVFSSKHVTDLINSMSEQDKKYVDDIVANLNKLSSKTTTVIPDSSNAEPNTLYLYSADPNPTSYNQYMVLSDKTILDLGDTNISLEGYLKETDADGKYLKQVDSHSHNNKLILDSMSQDKIDKWDSGVSENKVKEIIDSERPITTTIDSTSTDTQIPSAKSVYDKYNIYDKSEAYSNIIINPLLADATNPNGIYNKDGIVSRDTTENLDTFKLPIDCSWGIREIFWKSPGNLVSKITGMDLNNKPGTWINVLRGDVSTHTWSGWYRLCTTKVADVAPHIYTSFETSTLTRGIQVEVKNGICTISGWPFGSNATGYGISILKNIPMPTGTRTAPIVVDTTGEIIGMIYVDDGRTDLNAHFYKVGEGYFVLSYPVAES